MRLIKLVEELGPLTVLAQIRTVKGDLSPIQQEIARTLPLLPPMGGEAEKTLRANLAGALKVIPELHAKQRLVLVGPELMLLELWGEMGFGLEVIVVVDSYLPHEIVARISANVPAGVVARIVQVPAVPFSISPAEAVMVAAGFDGGCGYALVPQSTQRILNFYGPLYFGEVIMLDPLGFPILSRPEGWVTVNTAQFFTQHLGKETERRSTDVYQRRDEERFAHLPKLLS